MIYPEDDSEIGNVETLNLKFFSSEIEDNFRDRKVHCIHIWAKDQNSKNYLLRIAEFPVTCCLELPKYDSETQELIDWNLDLANAIFKYFVWCMNKKNIVPPYAFELVEKNDIYDYSPYKKYYINISCKIDETRKAISKMCNQERKITYGKNFTSPMTLKLIPHEGKISTLRRLMSIQNISFSQWFSVEARFVPLHYSDRASIDSIQEYFINWKTITPIAMSCEVNPTIASWDIETYSDNHRSMPSSFSLLHCIYLISVVYVQLSHPETKKSYCIIFGECNDVEGTEIIKVNSELEGLFAFANLIRKLDPDIISGYNIFAYDFDYLINRLHINLIDNFPSMSRIIGKPFQVYNTKWASGAYGKNQITFIIMEGRIPIDLLPNIRRLFKLRTYKLDFVSKYFLGRGKHDISAQQMFKIYEESLQKTQYGIDQMTKVVAYCIEDSNLVIDLFDKIKIWYHLTEFSSVAGVSILDLFIRGEQVRCYSQIYHQCYLNGYVLSNGKQYDYYYSGGFVVDPIQGIHDYVFTYDFSSLYPSIIQAYNLCYTTFVPKELWNTVGEEKCHIIKFSQEEPIEHKSSDRNQNFELINENQDYERDEKILEDQTKTKIRKYEFRFLKPEYRTGIMPFLEKMWVSERNKIKKELKEVKVKLSQKYDRELEIRSIILDKRQNAIKVLANSGYGFMGVEKNGLLSGLPIAMCVTAMGRELVNEATQFFKTRFAHYGAELVYGDTDSSMIRFKLDKSADLKAIAKETEEAISGRPQKILPDGTIIPEIKPFFPPPLKMECENVCRILCIKKKMYAKVIMNLETGEFERTSDGKLEITSKGILTAKRGKSKFSMEVYSDALQRILSKDSIINVLKSLCHHMVSLLQEKYNPREYLTMVQELGSDYKSENYSMNLFASHLSNSGHPVKTGDRLEFIIVRTEQEDQNLTLSGSKREKFYIGNKMREITLWEQNENRENIDYLYYCCRGLENSYDLLFNIGFKQLLEDPEIIKLNLGYKPQFSACHFVSFKTPIKMISTFIEDYLKIPTEKFELNFGKEKKFSVISKLLNSLITSICYQLQRYDMEEI